MTADRQVAARAPWSLSSHRWLVLIGVTVCLVVGLWLFRDLEHHVSALERHLGDLGWRGWFVFVVVTAAFTTALVPDTLFAVIAGVLFGWVGGTCLMLAACLCGSTFQFFAARRLLRATVESAISHRPKLAAIQRLVEQEGLRFQFLLRLTPINPVLVSYVLGASRCRFATFSAALTGLIPMLALEVYFGHAAGHAVGMLRGHGDISSQKSIMVGLGLVTIIGLSLYISRIAKRTLKTYPEPGLVSGTRHGEPSTAPNES